MTQFNNQFNSEAVEFLESENRYFTFSTFDLMPNSDLYNNQYYKMLLAIEYQNYFSFKWSKLIKSAYSADFLTTLNKANKLNQQVYLPFEGDFRQPIKIGALKTLQELACYSSQEFFFKDINDAFVLTHHKNRKTFKEDLNELIEKSYLFVKQVSTGKYKNKYFYLILNPQSKIVNM